MSKKGLENYVFNTDSSQSYLLNGGKPRDTGIQEKNMKNPETARENLNIPWTQYIFYVHVIVLYVLLFTVYNEMRRTKNIMYEFHLKIINISEKTEDCLWELSSLRSAVRFSDEIARTSVREVPTAPAFRGWEESSDALESPNNLLQSDTPPATAPYQRVRRGAGAALKTREVEEKPRAQQEKRGKLCRRNRCRSRHSGFPRAIQFIGALPEPIIRDGGALAPWMVDSESIKDLGLKSKVSERGGEVVEIHDSGLYFIYAQVYYLNANASAQGHSSFQIIQKREGADEVVVAVCATLGEATVSGEASCFTGCARSLRAGDTIYVKQRERDRHLIMSRGHTYLGLVLLNRR